MPKYINKYYKNGKWNYEYDEPESKSNRSTYKKQAKISADAKQQGRIKQKSIKSLKTNRPTLKGLYKDTDLQSTYRQKTVKNSKTAGTRKTKIGDYMSTINPRRPSLTRKEQRQSVEIQKNYNGQKTLNTINKGLEIAGNTIKKVGKNLIESSKKSQTMTREEIEQKKRENGKKTAEVIGKTANGAYITAKKAVEGAADFVKKAQSDYNSPENQKKRAESKKKASESKKKASDTMDNAINKIPGGKYTDWYKNYLNWTNDTFLKDNKTTSNKKGKKR